MSSRRLTSPLRVSSRQLRHYVAAAECQLANQKVPFPQLPWQFRDRTGEGKGKKCQRCRETGLLGHLAIPSILCRSSTSSETPTEALISSVLIIAFTILILSNSMTWALCNLPQMLLFSIPRLWCRNARGMATSSIYSLPCIKAISSCLR